MDEKIERIRRKKVIEAEALVEKKFAENFSSDAADDFDPAYNGGNVLPPLPEDNQDFHYAWVRVDTDKNPDKHNYIEHYRFGFRPVSPSEMPGYESYTVNQADSVAVISVRDVIAMKIPMRNYIKLRSYQDGIADYNDRALNQVPRELQGDPNYPAKVERKSTLRRNARAADELHG